jgi:catechol 2,3-dioxygenase-like lactoylglutathione lyase family enzyme
MPTLNHINLPVLDVASLRDFFVQHFAFVPIHSPAGSPLAVLRGDSGFILNIMQRKPDDGAFPKDFHVGFLFDSTDAVLAMHATLAATGIRIGDVERMTRRSITSDTFYCFAPNDVMVEVSCYAAHTSTV